MKTPFGNMVPELAAKRAAGILPAVPFSPAPTPKPRPPRSPKEVARIEAICATCKWNVDWICEHSGCRPCKQRVAGGLKLYLCMASFRCPARLW